jgi:hypothetical protein
MIRTFSRRKWNLLEKNINKIESMKSDKPEKKCKVKSHPKTNLCGKTILTTSKSGKKLKKTLKEQEVKWIILVKL